MKTSQGFAILLLLMVCHPARPDTITTTDGSSVNGSILEVSKNVVKIRSQFPSNTREIWVPVQDIQSIEFNSQTFNPGAPPEIQGWGPPTQESQAKAAGGGVTIVLRGGERKPCNLTAIDADAVHCGFPDAVYPRSKVLRINFGS